VVFEQESEGWAPPKVVRLSGGLCACWWQSGYSDQFYFLFAKWFFLHCFKVGGHGFDPLLLPFVFWTQNFEFMSGVKGEVRGSNPMASILTSIDRPVNHKKFRIQRILRGY
jgi:hypothetical protein